jgi:hypothetical protein
VRTINHTPGAERFFGWRNRPGRLVEIEENTMREDCLMYRPTGCLLVLLLMMAFTPTPSAQATCDRACLRGALDQYLAAVIKHDPAAAPLAVGFRQTENAVVVGRGEGVWKTVTGLGKVQRRYVDPESGQAAYYGIVEEGTASAVVTARVRVENRTITEAEWYVARPGDPGLNGPAQPGRGPANLFNPEYLTANPPPQRVVPVAQRLSRDAMVAIANSYFDGITTHDGSIVLAHPGCNRIENGTLMTGRRGGGAGPRGGAAPAPPPLAPAPPGNDCVAGFANLTMQFVAARRFPVVDVEAGVVLATAVFIRPPGSPTPRNVFSEWFIIDDGRIRNIYTAMFYPPPQLPVPNWPPYEGNWPLPAAIVPAPAAPATRN